MCTPLLRRKKMVTGEKRPATQDVRSIVEFQPFEPPVLVANLYPPAPLCISEVCTAISTSYTSSQTLTKHWAEICRRIKLQSHIYKLSILARILCLLSPLMYCHEQAAILQPLRTHALRLLHTVWCDCITLSGWLGLTASGRHHRQQTNKEGN